MLTPVAWTAPVRAEDAKAAPPAPWEGDILTRKELSGGWFGLRNDLDERGIDIDLRLSQYYQGVASGGVDTNGEYGGTMDYRVNVDGDKLGLWPGFGINTHARTRFGEDVSSDAGSLTLPNAGMLMQSPGDFHGTNITGFTVSQTFPLFKGREGAVTVGNLDVIDLVTGFFPHLGYGQEGLWNVNSLVSAMPWFGSVQGRSLYGVVGP